MTNNTPHPSEVVGLLMPVVSKPWEVVCKSCLGHKLAYDSRRLGGKSHPCPKCHGTGTCTVRLVGWVEAWESSDPSYPGHYIVPDLGKGTMDGIKKLTYEAYHAGTLPESVTRWLHVEEVE